MFQATLLLSFGFTVFVSAQCVYPVGAADVRPAKSATKNGYRIVQSFNNVAGHTGIDLANGLEGGDVRAACPGTVVEVRLDTSGKNSGFGNLVRIRHEILGVGTVFSQYGHLMNGSVTVAFGQNVDTAQLIGKVDCSGYSMGKAACPSNNKNGPHLHFSIQLMDRRGCGYLPDKRCPSDTFALYYDPLQFVEDHFNQESGEWLQRHFGYPPPGRLTAAMAYDSLRQQVVLFGGNIISYTMSVRVNDTWVWNGTAWTQKFPTTSPPAYPSTIFMAYHSSRDETVLVTNYDNRFVWIWDGNNWTQRFHASLPSLLWFGPIVYDSARNVVFMFTGSRTLTWDGSSWTILSPMHQPSNRRGHALAYDEVRSEVVLFGGEDTTSGVQLDDTWVWNGVDWIRRLPVTKPHARHQHAMSFDGKKVVLLGGLIPVQLAGETWLWDGANWTRATSEATPQYTTTPLMVFDRMRQETIYYAGICCFATPEVTPSALWAWVP